MGELGVVNYTVSFFINSKGLGERRFLLPPSSKNTPSFNFYDSLRDLPKCLFFPSISPSLRLDGPSR